MSGESRILAEFAAGLKFADIPPPVIATAKACIIDTIAVALFGSRLPWSRSVEDYARHVGAVGKSSILGPSFPKVSAPAAALANGTFAHAFEFDNLRQPSIGVHPGATAGVAALAAAEESSAPGRDLVTAFVAGCECMFRIALAAKSSSEKIGFHAPGLTGVFGSAIAVSKIMSFDVVRTLNAMGIAGSFCSGLLAFAKAGNGGMVKRLHMGRAAEGGVTAANLAERGFEGPDAILEGRFGYLDVYTRDGDPELLVDGLGERWEMLTTAFKFFPCHVTAQAPVAALLELKRRAQFEPDAVERIVIEAAEKVLSHHADTSPRDVATAQYSVPFSAALAIVRDPTDPCAFLDGLQHPKVIDLCSKIELKLPSERREAENIRSCRVQIVLKDGTVLTAHQNSLTNDQEARQDRIEKKFMTLGAGLPEGAAAALLARLNELESYTAAELFARV
jgi:2-methylcitrate dehydratase PrpD